MGMSRQNPISRRDIDSKGRVTLGASFANRSVIVEERGDEIVLKLARLVPEAETWIYENVKALSSIRRGLNQARAKKFAKTGPDLKAAARLANDLEEA